MSHVPEVRPPWARAVGAGSWLMGLVASARAAAADTNGLPDTASSLRPPRDEIQPVFWEQYGAWMILLGALLVATAAVAVWLVTRPKKTVPIPWFVQARQDLERFREQPEDGVVLSSVSQILRRHLSVACGLAREEATTSEFCRTLADSDKIGAELSSEIGGFLRECDQRKFAPVPPATPCGAVNRSLTIIQKVQDRLAQQGVGAGASSGKSDSAGSSLAGGDPRVASEV